MKLLVIYPYFVGHGAPGHSLMYDTLVGLTKMGHHVTVVSGEGGYMQETGVQAARPWWKRIIYSEQLGPIRVLRTYSFRKHQGGLTSRGFSYALLALLNPVAVMFAGRPDVALLSPPPLYPIFTSLLACRFRRIPVVTEVRDLWPGSIAQMGLVKNRWLLAITSWMERVVYNASRAIVALTEGIREDIAVRGWSNLPVLTLQCAVDADLLRADESSRARIRSSYGWEGKFLLMYFGALGEANNLPVYLRAARRLTAHPDVRLVLIGDGFRRGWFEEQIRAEGLRNVEVLPPVAKSRASEYLSAADACVVTLQDLPVFSGAIPTKLMEYMACGRPVLCGVRGEAERIMASANCGYCFEPDDDEKMVQLAIKLKTCADDARRMGESGRSFALLNFDLERRQQQLAAILEAASDNA